MAKRLQKELGLLRPLARTPLDPANIELVQSCLRTSDYLNANKYIPKRLLDLGSTQGLNPRVIEMRDCAPLAQTEGNCPILYGALSYCWGPPEDAKQQTMLTSETRQRLSQGIPMDELTNIVQDAITACRAFGLRYLWIDALCIMQQDKIDWEEQSYEMALIFSNSSITFCIPSSSTCLQGFLTRPVPPQLQIHITCNSSQTEGTACFLQSGNKLQGFLWQQESALERDVKGSRWNKRGWVFQEKVLSPRKIFFGTEMIHVNVDDTVTSENGYTLKQEANSEISYFPKDHMNVTPEAIIRQSPKVPVFWYDIMEKYSKKEWTNGQDIFPALSGIARIFKDIYKDDYVAGVWVGDLKCGLVFDTNEGSKETFSDLLHFLSDGTRKIGPSWSWASRPEFYRFVMSLSSNLRCRVRSHLRAEFQLLHIQNNVDGTNPLGRIHSASLTLSGVVLGVSEVWRPRDNGRGYIYTFSPGHEAYLGPDWRILHNITDEDRSKIRLLLISSCCSAPAEQIHQWIDGYPDDAEIYRRETKIIYITQYASSFANDQDPDFNPATDCTLCAEGQERDAWGLMIYPAGLPNQYFRVGFFITRAYFGGWRIFDHAQKEEIELV
ncbi:hypothetical protein NHQ30_010104 [Ciborinia camelliae]|nr:hypothetical protein NHQ30_010104 [Ciborinia camelliae]